MIRATSNVKRKKTHQIIIRGLLNTQLLVDGLVFCLKGMFRSWNVDTVVEEECQEDFYSDDDKGKHFCEMHSDRCQLMAVCTMITYTSMRYRCL